jgi:two-component system cell cycle response regulator DivK
MGSVAKILVVEDNLDNRTLIVFLLKHSGHAVLSAEDGETALVMARAEQPDVILMDIQLPGMSGLEVTAACKADPAIHRIPVIAVTALAMNGDEARIRAAGCDGYLAKPIRYRELLGLIEEFVGPASA